MSQLLPSSQAPTAAFDINAETYPFEVVQRELDHAVYLNLYSMPEPVVGARDTTAPVTCVTLRERLHRFEVFLQNPAGGGALRALNRIGESLGSFHSRWVFIPDGYSARPGREAPSMLFRPEHPQRFEMRDGICRWGNGSSGFEGFGTGLTFPIRSGGDRVAAAAVGTILRGFGAFSDHEGTYTYCGTISPSEGFRGNLLIRIMDAPDTVGTRRALPPLSVRGEVEPGVTYIVFRGQKGNSREKSGYDYGPSGEIVGLDVSQQLRLMHVDAAFTGRGDLRSRYEVGPVIGSMRAKIRFNLLNPGAPGTSAAPIPFQSYNRYTFFDANGREIGGFDADAGEGRTFLLQLAGTPRQRALRFGGFGPLLNGTGCFAGIEGLMTDNSVVGLAPHALATFYALRIRDPRGRFRNTVEKAWV